MDPWGTPNKTFMRRLLDPLTWTTVPAFCWTNNPETIKALPLAHPFFLFVDEDFMIDCVESFSEIAKNCDRMFLLV